MTTAGKHLVGVFLITLILLLGLIGLVTSCRTSSTAEEGSQVIYAEVAHPPPPTRRTQPSPTAPSVTQRAVVSSTPLSTTQLFLAPVLQMAGQLVPIPTARAAISTPASPTPTVGLAELLSQTIEVQAQVAVSVARVARALAASIQPPIEPLPITSTASSTTTDDLTTDDVTTDEATAIVPDQSALTITAPLTQASPYPVPVPAAQLAPDGEVRRAYVPVLMYHYLSVPPANTDIYRRDLSVAPDRFAAHLDRLQAEGYTTISPYALYEYLTQGTPLPPKPVLLTFDDGYRDNYENALPLLTARKMTATFFIVVDFINRERPEYLSWEMVRALHDAGMTVEAHGVDHTTLRGRAPADLEFQALRSYETIQDRIGVRPRFISYPAGEYDAATITMFQNAGYWAGFTTVQGATHRGDELFTLRRVRIRNTTTADELMNLLTADW